MQILILIFFFCNFSNYYVFISDGISIITYSKPKPKAIKFMFKIRESPISSKDYTTGAHTDIPYIFTIL
jgi:hypothetical protein